MYIYMYCMIGYILLFWTSRMIPSKKWGSISLQDLQVRSCYCWAWISGYASAIADEENDEENNGKQNRTGTPPNICCIPSKETPNKEIQYWTRVSLRGGTLLTFSPKNFPPLLSNILDADLQIVWTSPLILWWMIIFLIHFLWFLKIPRWTWLMNNNVITLKNITKTNVWFLNH